MLQRTSTRQASSIDLWRDWEKREMRIEVKRSDIDLGPDFEALGAFALNFPDGSKIQHLDFDGANYEVRGGKLVPDVDELTTELIEEQIEPPLEQGILTVTPATDTNSTVERRKVEAVGESVPIAPAPNVVPIMPADSNRKILLFIVLALLAAALPALVAVRKVHRISKGRRMQS